MQQNQNTINLYLIIINKKYLKKMARPIRNNCDYFPHDNNMRNHVKVKAVRAKFQNGYAIWGMLLEYLTGCDGNVFENSEIQYELLSGDFGFSATEIRDFVDYCISKLELLFEKDGFIYSESLNERLKPVYDKRGKAKELSKKQQRINGKFCNNNTKQTVVTVTETPQRKEKEKKENKIKKEKYSFDFVSDKFKVIFFEWIQYKKERNEMYKTQTSLQTCYNNLLKFSKDNSETAKEIVNNSIGNNWSGFFPLKENNKPKQHSQVLTEQQFYEPLKRE